MVESAVGGEGESDGGECCGRVLKLYHLKRGVGMISHWPICILANTYINHGLGPMQYLLLII